MRTLICLGLLLALSACKKDDYKPSNTLPEITQEGANTFGFVLDEMVWVPYAPCQFFSNPCAELGVEYAIGYDHSFGFSAQRNSDEDTRSFITFTLRSEEGIKKAGEYFDKMTVSYKTEEESDDGELVRYYLDRNQPGNFTITRLDTVEQVISGHFNFVLKGENGERRTVSDGRFDVEMTACLCR